MSKLTKSKSERSSSDGFVLPFCGFMLVVIFGVASFVIDIGNARYQLRTIQIVADACSMAALTPLGSATAPKYTAVEAEVRNIALLNGVSQAEISDINCGVWNAGVFNSQNNNCDAAGTNAVQVLLARQVNTFFGRILNTAFTTPATSAVSSMTPEFRCVRPFVIQENLISGLDKDSVFQTSGSAAGQGNWGKLLIGPVHFKMTEDVCDNKVTLNGVILSETGNEGVSQAFLDVVGTTFTLAVTSTSPLKGRKDVTITEFIRVRLDSSQGNGNSEKNGWKAKFTIVDRRVSPNSDPSSSQRKLVK